LASQHGIRIPNGTAGRGTAARPTNSGPGRVLVAVYGLFALSATARAVVQIATKFHVAPLSYLLSALSGAIYIVATVALARSQHRIALICCSIELLGVLGVGLASVLDRSAFPDPSVWSEFGMGYGFVPLVLPVLGLLWLRSRRSRPGPGEAHPTS
jgi:hypothetical protein